jgi:glucosamine--fructose-6-phosphate aminotransferase (isomerizing)
MADYVLPLLAGTERSVLATKSFLAMVVRMLQLSVGRDVVVRELTRSLPAIDGALATNAIHDLARRIAEGDHGITLGKEIGHKVALEAALKIKEGSYVHAEAFLTGELKHGPLALVTDDLPCMLFAMTEAEASAARIASREIMSRGGYTVGIGILDATDCDDVIAILDCGHATALPAIVLAQRIGYGVAVARGVDPDYPRNLAKSVTVR